MRVLRRNRFNLSIGGAHLSRHRTVQGAVLAAQAHADQTDKKSIYRIKVGGGLFLENLDAKIFIAGAGITGTPGKPGKTDPKKHI